MRGRKKPAEKQSGSIRIIAGKWRGRKLPVANSQGLRPTTDRTKETLFNWLMQDVTGAVCLDLFAGAGSLGVEALSRYADKAVFIEKQSNVAKNLFEIRELLNISDGVMSVFSADAMDWLSHQKSETSDKFDLVFIDPPFHKQLVAPAISRLIDMELLKNNALIYVEHEADLDWSVPGVLKQIKQKNTQQVASRLFEYYPT